MTVEIGMYVQYIITSKRPVRERELMSNQARRVALVHKNKLLLHLLTNSFL